MACARTSLNIRQIWSRHTDLANPTHQHMLQDWIGLPFGSKVRATGGSRGWVYLLAPTPDLWSL
eukprot:scaffold52383_cov22-Tisochrysis_lutea.AAC.1